MTRLQGLPNIGPVLAQRLEKAGIASAEEFLALGDEAAFARLVALYPEDACTHTRLALAGAARNTRWMALDRQLRQSLCQGAALKRHRTKT
ncbi:MAG TPA: TfoX/Sxy family DNA transformation protein [Devosiaceae bacterium]|jgi:DNA transformation protein